jgi:hypothetical protein
MLVVNEFFNIYGELNPLCKSLCPEKSCDISIKSKCNDSNDVILPIVPMLQSDVMFGYIRNFDPHGYTSYN